MPRERMRLLWKGVLDLQGPARVGGSDNKGVCAQRVVKLRTMAEGRVSGACRCIKFGEGPVDLMAFSEHSSHCHLVDSRAYHDRQVPVHLPVLMHPCFACHVMWRLSRSAWVIWCLRVQGCLP